MLKYSTLKLNDVLNLLVERNPGTTLNHWAQRFARSGVFHAFVDFENELWSESALYIVSLYEQEIEYDKQYLDD